MSEVKRYEDEIYGPSNYDFEESEDGTWVKYEDYAALKAKRDALEERVKQLEWDSVFIPKGIEAALAVMGVALPESKEEFNFSINRWVQQLVDRVIRFGPELDAERNNLRAEGVEMFALYLVETAIKEGADLDGWKSTASNEGCDYAAQLRTGQPR